MFLIIIFMKLIIFYNKNNLLLNILIYIKINKN